MGDVGSDKEREYKGMTASKTEAVTAVMLPQPRNTLTWKRKRKTPR